MISINFGKKKGAIELYLTDKKSEEEVIIEGKKLSYFIATQKEIKEIEKKLKELKKAREFSFYLEGNALKLLSNIEEKIREATASFYSYLKKTKEKAGVIHYPKFLAKLVDKKRFSYLVAEALFFD